MDRDRLREVHRSEQSESRVNEEFVDWLKNKGPTYLLVFLAILFAYMMYVRLGESREARQAEAWTAFAESEMSGLPSAYEGVAEQYPKVDSVALISRLRAAQHVMEAVQAGVPVGADPTSDRDIQSLSDEDRESYLARADRLYQSVLDADDGSRKFTLFAVSALNGRAAVAEARGNLDEARSNYQQAASRAGDLYPQLAQQARERAERLDVVRELVSLPSRAERDATQPPAETRRSISIDEALRDYLLP